MVLYNELLLLDMLSALPTDVLGIVHAFLSTGARCVTRPGRSVPLLLQIILLGSTPQCVLFPAPIVYSN